MSTRNLTVGALIRDDDDRIFVQRRAETRTLFPGCWDVVGGSVEAGETVLDALHRELFEETGWRLSRVLTRIGRNEWFANGQRHVEVDYVVEVDGDLRAPRLEWDKHPEFAWLAPGDLALLDENVRRSGSTFIKDIVTSAHRWLRETPPQQRTAISVG